MIPSVDVVGIGENSVDLVLRVAGPVTANAKLRITDRRVSPGGQVATALCACARLGLRCRYVGRFGNDGHGRLIQQALEDAGVGTDASRVCEAPNRYALILLDDRTGERLVLWQRDPALALQPGDLPADLVAGARLLHVDNVDESAAIAAARRARGAGLHVTTDIDSISDRTSELLDSATFPILAECVPSRLTGEPDPERALRRLRQRHGGVVCVTLGERGAMLLDGDRLFHQPAFAVDAVDTTGAGDVFRGALIYALLRGDGPGAMLRFASAAAAVSCLRPGAIGGVPSLAEIETMATEGTEHRSFSGPRNSPRWSPPG